MPAAIAELRGVTKRFPGVVAARNVSIAFHPGTVHALLGENGAGKSTLVKILSGIQMPDDGEVLLNGEAIRLHAPIEAEKRGVAVVHQHRTLVEDISVAENLFLGRLGSGWRIFRRGDLNRRAAELLAAVGLQLDPKRSVRSLSPAEQQFLEIARAIGRNARLFVFDEPTTSLTPPERDRLFRQIGRLKAEGHAVVYISHDLEDALKLSDEITVLRDGAVVAHEFGLRDVGRVVQHMIGRALEAAPPRERGGASETILRVSALHSGRLKGVNLDVRRGEIVCVAGLVGSGRTELLRALFGLDRSASGAIELGGSPFVPRSPRASIEAGIGFVSEDRKGQGLVLERDVAANLVLGNESALARLGFMVEERERGLATHAIRSLRIKTPSAATHVGKLSGGNQQKVVLGRWLARSPRLLLIDEPTVGIDVGARAEFYKLLDTYVAGGGACLVVSSDLGEVLELADRVVVMRDGASVGEIGKDTMSRDSLLHAMTAVAA